MRNIQEMLKISSDEINNLKQNYIKKLHFFESLMTVFQKK